MTHFRRYEFKKRRYCSTPAVANLHDFSDNFVEELKVSFERKKSIDLDISLRLISGYYHRYRTKSKLNKRIKMAVMVRSGYEVPHRLRRLKMKMNLMRCCRMASTLRIAVKLKGQEGIQIFETIKTQSQQGPILIVVK